MASIVRRFNPIAFRVVWREKGLPGQQGRTFHTLPEANLFLKLVQGEGRGNDRMPPDEVLRRYGLLPTGSGVKVEHEQRGDQVTVVEAVRRYVDEYLAGKPERTRPAERTLKEYRSLYRNYILDSVLGQFDVANVDGEQIEQWATEQSGRQRRDRRVDESGAPVLLSAVSINKAMTLLSAMFKWAMMGISGPRGTDGRRIPLRRMGGNPTLEVERVKVHKNEEDEKAVLFNIAEYEAFLRAIYVVDPTWADMVAVTMFTGSRFGEITALRVEQVDFDLEVINFDRRISAGKEEGGTKGSKRAPETWIKRRVRVPQAVMTLLRARCFTANGRRKPGTDFVFDGPEFSTNKRWSPASDNDRWVRLEPILDLFELNRHFRHHNMRHSYVTFLQDHGIPEVMVGFAVGHRGKSMSVTGRIYTHVTPEMWTKIVNIWTPVTRELLQIREKGYAALFERRLLSVAS
jgi:integrase